MQRRKDAESRLVLNFPYTAIFDNVAYHDLRVFLALNSVKFIESGLSLMEKWIALRHCYQLVHLQQGKFVGLASV